MMMSHARRQHVTGAQQHTTADARLPAPQAAHIACSSNIVPLFEAATHSVGQLHLPDLRAAPALVARGRARGGARTAAVEPHTIRTPIARRVGTAVVQEWLSCVRARSTPPCACGGNSGRAGARERSRVPARTQIFSMSQEIEYSEKYFDDDFEYRCVRASTGSHR
jgi:hypothetical protein